MKNLRRFSLLLVLALSPSAAQAQGYSANTLSVEGLGVGGLYSVFYSRRVDESVAINLGFSQWSFEFFTNIHLTLLPVSASYLIGGKNSFLELNAGAAPVFASSDSGTVDLGEAGAIPVSGASDSAMYEFVGVGYRYWPAGGGFHFRVTGYVLTSGSEIQPYGGISLGYAF